MKSYDPNAKYRFPKQVVRLTLMQWGYRAVHEVRIGGNCAGFSVMESAVDALFDRLCDDGDDPFVILTNPAGETLHCADDGDQGCDWLKEMCVGVEIVEVILPAKPESAALSRPTPQQPSNPERASMERTEQNAPASRAASAVGPTPGPWFLSKDGFSGKRPCPTVYAADDHLRYIAFCDDFGSGTDNLANAELIVRAVNAHADLLAALQEARGYVLDYGSEKNMAPVVARIDAAIARATGERK